MDNYQLTLTKSRVYKKKPHQIIDMILNNKIEERYLPSIYRELYSYINDTRFLNFVKLVLLKKANPMTDKKYILALYNMFQKKDMWINDVSKWKRKSYNVDNQMSDLSRYLFCKYDVPTFMDKCWYISDTNWIDWFIHIGQGGNIRTANIPVKFTKKMAFNFLSAPDEYTPNEAIRWSQIYGLGGDEKLVRGIIESKIGNDFANSNFWDTIIHFFVRNPMIDDAQISSLIDYISYTKYEGDRNYDVGGLVSNPPPNPSFEIKGRTVASLIRSMEKWHKEIGKNDKKNISQSWDGFDLNDFTFKTGKDKNLRIFKIQQLLTANELKKEGSAHGHCVGSYSRSCITGRSSIWSMSVEKIGQTKPLLTIEVNRDKYINQVRGKGNRRSTGYEDFIISKWSTEEGLKKTRWV